MPRVAEVHHFGVCTRAWGAKTLVFDCRVPSCNKNWSNIASTSEKTEETTTKALDLLFNVGYSIFELLLSLQRYVPITVGCSARASWDRKIPQIFAEIPQNSEIADLRAPRTFF